MNVSFHFYCQLDPGLCHQKHQFTIKLLYSLFFNLLICMKIEQEYENKYSSYRKQSNVILVIIKLDLEKNRFGRAERLSDLPSVCCYTDFELISSFC